MTTKNGPTTEQLEDAMSFILNELKNTNGWENKEDLRVALSDVAFFYTRDFPKYQTNN